MEIDHAIRARYASCIDENTGTTLRFGRRVVMSPEVFESLPTVEPESVIAGIVCKALVSIDGCAQWHAVERVTKSDCVASPIEVRRYIMEPA